jgi:hypothetical protein
MRMNNMVSSCIRLNKRTLMEMSVLLGLCVRADTKFASPINSTASGNWRRNHWMMDWWSRSWVNSVKGAKSVHVNDPSCISREDSLHSSSENAREYTLFGSATSIKE